MHDVNMVEEALLQSPHIRKDKTQTQRKYFQDNTSDQTKDNFQQRFSSATLRTICYVCLLDSITIAFSSRNQLCLAQLVVQQYVHKQTKNNGSPTTASTRVTNTTSALAAAWEATKGPTTTTTRRSWKTVTMKSRYRRENLTNKLS